jgi:hypothetical protein
MNTLDKLFTDAEDAFITAMCDARIQAMLGTAAIFIALLSFFALYFYSDLTMRSEYMAQSVHAW